MGRLARVVLIPGKAADPKQVAALPVTEQIAATATEAWAQKTIADLKAYVKRNTP